LSNILTKKAQALIFLEKARQVKKWGRPNYHMSIWQLILSEEVGELATAVKDLMFQEDYNPGDKDTATIMRIESIKECTQVAAVAFEMLEVLLEDLYKDVGVDTPLSELFTPQHIAFGKKDFLDAIKGWPKDMRDLVVDGKGMDGSIYTDPETDLEDDVDQSVYAEACKEADVGLKPD
jgi:hypothetical protein